MIWRQQAESLANWAKKGVLIGITGRIQTRNYENQQGQRVHVTEVGPDSFQMLESLHERGNVTTPQPSANQNNQKQSSPADGHDLLANSESMNIEDDQLPF